MARLDMFIESPDNESDEQFRACVTELLTTIYKRIPTWLEFRVGRRIEFRGVYFVSLFALLAACRQTFIC